MLLLADLVAALHAAAVLVMVSGSLLALRWPRLLWLHAPVALTILAFHLAGAPCPLTTWELALREAAGAAPYTGGFLGHYAFAPFGIDIRSTAAQATIYATAITPNAIGYGLLAARAVRGPAQGRATPDGGRAAPRGSARRR